MTIAETEKNGRRILIWALIYLVPAYEAMLPIVDPDIWWHLRTGQWIVEHGRVPFQDSFSVYGAGRTWIAYSWLFEILVYGIFSRFGLTGLVLFNVALSLMIAFAIHKLLRRADLPFLVEAVLLTLCLASLKPALSLRPWLFSILFLAMELWVLFGLRGQWKPWLVYLLPPLFLLWANLHIQFVYGLAVLGLFVGVSMAARYWPGKVQQDPVSSLSTARLLIVLGLSTMATLANPYGYVIYQPVFDYALQTGAFDNIVELHPMSFRSASDWFVLLLAGSAAFVLGWQRGWNIFSMVLLLLSAAFAFRARRDGWFLVLASAAVIANCSIFVSAHDRSRFTIGTIIAVAVACLASLYVLSFWRDISSRTLEKRVESLFPVQAVKFVRSQGFKGPLYNHLDWGGYLIWGLPDLPVAIDGRTNLHGDERLSQSLRTWDGAQGWDKDPELSNARLIIAEKPRPLTALLRQDSRFNLVYEDATAVVFTFAVTAPRLFAR